MKDKVKAVARESIIVWPQSPSDKKSNKYVKGHDSVAPALQKDLSLTIVDPTSKKGYKDEQTLEAFAEFLKTAKVKAAPVAPKTKAKLKVAQVAMSKAKANDGKSSSSLPTFKKPAANVDVDDEASGCSHTIVCVCV